MLRRPALAALVLCAVPAPALANPSFSVSQFAEGVPGNVPSKVTHRLTITAGATQETVGLSAAGSLGISGNPLSVDDVTAVGPPVFRCPGKWDRPHEAHGQVSVFKARVTLAPFATAFADTTTSFKKPPWASDTLDTTWEITPAQGTAFSITSTAPFYEGPMGVELDFTLTRVSRRVYAVTGTTDSGADSGRVELWGYAPGAKRASRLAITRVRGGGWNLPRLRLSRSGRWEFYARYRTAGDAFANDASVCGTVLRIH